MAMKRGCEVILSHFFNSTIHSAEVRKKILLLAEKLAEFHPIKLYMVPFEDIQMEIIKIVPSKLRMVVYRRSMMRMANLIAEKEKAKAIVTGDSLSQVASQTLENLNVIHSASNRLVLSPLLGFDKEEIIQKAKEIGTYEISILPYEDCCTLMVAKHPETRARVEQISQYESFEEMEELAVSRAEVFEYK
jgi:thiamine biosynthesis protein ThiI